MTRLKRLTYCVLFIFLLAGGLAAADFDLRVEQLSEPLKLLSTTDRSVVDDAIGLIRDGKHSLALARLTSLQKASPGNSSLRIVSAYALLQVGNLLGAFEEAEAAHEAPNGGSYKCWFLAKVALLAGKEAVCRREIEHVRKVGYDIAEVKKLESELNKKN